jgi:D-alanyl-D-alanine carboxypeptidase
MFERFTKEARTIVRRAEQEAEALGSPTIEAEHLLLALADDRAGGAAAVLLRDEGLDPGGVHAALERETELSLAAAGVSLADFALPETPSAPRRRPRIAASTRRALERALRTVAARGDRRIGSGHVLVGVLRAEVGTVPRALASAGVDRIALATRAESLGG